MKVITAKILDATHLELSQPIYGTKGKFIRITIPEDGEAERLWREAAKEHLLDAYEAEDAIYDEI